MTKQPPPTFSERMRDRKTQLDKLRAFFRTHPDTIWTQATLAEACGCAVSTVRSRISELVLEHEPLRWHQSGWRSADGNNHATLRSWEYVSRPAEPLGRDAGDEIAQKSLFS